MLLKSTFPCLASLAVLAAAGEFPAKVQVDLVFPKNETYAPTGYFPVIYAIHNFRTTEHLNFDLHGTIKTDKSRHYEHDASVRYRDFDTWRFPDRYRYFGSPWFEPLDADPMFLVTSISTITNGTDSHFYVGWTMGMANCTDLDWEDDPTTIAQDGNIPWETKEQLIEFSVSPDGKMPNIEEAIRSCGYKSFAVDVEGKSFGNHDAECGELREATASDMCGVLSEYAEGVAANVSKRVLSRLGCEEGTWQDIREDCPALGARYGLQSGWAALGVGVLASLLVL